MGNQTQVETREGSRSIGDLQRTAITKIKQEADTRKTRGLLEKTEPDNEIFGTLGKYEQKRKTKGWNHNRTKY